MKLKVKDINLTSGGPLIVVLHENTAKKLNIFPTDRVIIKRLKLNTSINCVLNVSTSGIEENEIGLFEEVLKKLKVEEGINLEVNRADKPISIKYIKQKLEGKTLKEKEINEIINSITENELTESELTYFVSACYSEGLSLKEAIYLTNAIVNSGETLKFKDKIILDKHCVGGVPGNRTTMIVIPILAALGYKMPKTSSRAITSASGTADTMEVLAPVIHSKTKILKIIKETNACIVWGGAVNLAGVDDKLIKIRHPLSIDPEGMLLASIMAKKKAAGATHVLIDIPYGEGAKIITKKQAKNLKKSFEKIGKALKMKMVVVLTDGSQPIGNGIGPNLEAIDVIKVLQGNGPDDLRNKSIFLATQMLKLAGETNAKKKVIETIENGKAYKKFIEIIVAQGGKKVPQISKALFFHNVKATHDGIIKRIRNKDISKIARLAGAPEDKNAGIYLRVSLNQKVKKDSELFTIYSNDAQNMKTAIKYLKTIKPIEY